MKKETAVIIRGDKKLNIPPMLGAVVSKLKTKESIAKARVDRFAYPTIKEIQSILDPRNITTDEDLATEVDIQIKNVSQIAEDHMECGNEMLFERDMKKLETLKDIKDFISE